MYTSKVV